MTLGFCRHCRYEPVASDAIRCPRCAGYNPNPSAASKVVHGVFLLAFAAIAIVVLGGACLMFRILTAALP